MNQPPSTYAALQQFPMASSPTGFNPQHPQHQQQQFYPSPNPNNPASAPQIHHPGQHHAFGPVPLHAPGAGAGAGAGAGGGAVMMSPGLPHHAAAPHPAQFTTNPPYAQSIVPSTVGQQPNFTQSQSPHHMGTPAQVHPQSMASGSGPGAMPPQAFSTPPRTSQAQQQQQLQAQMQTPLQGQQQPAISPQAAAREKARVTVLLDINSALLQEVINLQAAGKAGVSSNQPASQSQQSSPMQETNPSTASPTTASASGDFPGSSSSQGAPAKQSSQEYVECMRRLQANLAYLATVADRGKKSSGAAMQSPAIMTPPANVPAVVEMYAKLNELFKGTQPVTPQKAGVQGQPSPQGTVEATG